ncbi:LIC11966 family surface protein [Flavobacterium urocaniciphilum]|uniref:Uncharacterized protein n=1 Tax=Flavobacterium urocaniciphilum TaxID=1299341 RepID=A0A1H8YTE0_9FLAO|nr:hypothetical protein [Flavobacterium urocaniciphilum]SEP55379.1 hypothetical protein SAMN05444005_101188 [Flavobacterium urocaniciphilum]
MKKLTLLTFLLISTSFFAQDFKTPVAYLEYIAKQEDNITKETWKYTKTIAHSKSGRKIDATRKNLIKSIQTAHKNISNLKNGYNGDVEFKNIIVDYLKISEIIISEEYAKIIDLQEVSEQSYDFMEAYIKMQDLVNERMNREHEKVSVGQKKFAEKYNITLTEGQESAIGKKMALSNAVFNFQSDLYLIFFKCNITDLQLSKAIEAKDLAAIQQNSNSLAAYADEGLEKLKNIKPYNNDASLINATKKSLEAYKKVTVEQIPSVIDFFMFNNKFENAKQNIEKKKASDRTKEEIDSYNNLIKEINTKIANFNKVNTKFDQEKLQHVNSWNNTSSQFISKHIPND